MEPARKTIPGTGTTAWRWAALLIVAFFLSSACFGGKKNSDSQEEKALRAAGLDRNRVITIDAGQPIKIGVSSTLSGPLSSFGLAVADAAETIPTDSSVRGHPITFVRADDLCSAEGGAAAADRLIRAGVIAAVGPLCSSSALRANPVFDRAGITHISVAATRTDLTSPQRPEGPYITFLRLSATGKAIAEAEAQFAATKLGTRTAFIVSDGEIGPSDTADHFIQAFRRSGGTVAGSPYTFSPEQSDWGEALSAIRSSHPGMIYFAGYYPTASTFLLSLRADPTLASIPVVATDGVRSPELLFRAGAAAEGLYSVANTAHGADWGIYEREYRSRFKGEPGDVLYGPEAHDATSILFLAIQRSAKDDGGGRLTIDLGQLNKFIRASTFAGASGSVKFGMNGERADSQLAIVQLENGQWTNVAEEAPKSP
ncbi:MAG: branched-chain amino acid ABC transporter substrate-binding protein [Dehalococcoidia bacterium]|nr:branched-chain amino acid ABC transporter substrate-binding protein [Dehalococcoidia bacterium]